MASLQTLWPALHEAMVALMAHYGPVIDAAAEEVGIPLGEWYGWLMAFHVFDPEPVSVARLQVRAAYTSPAKIAQGLAQGERLGLLKPVGEGAYRLTAAGEAAVNKLIAAAYDAMIPLRPLPEPQLNRLADLLWRAVEACLAAPEPPGTQCLRTARRFDPGPAAPVMVRFDQYFSDLNAYRDDAHLASWRPLGVARPAWEALTFIWSGQAATLDGLCDRLAQRRGYGRQDYAAALQDLAGRGWIIEQAGHYSLTAAGRALRDEAEAATDRYFYAPLHYLSEQEVGELHYLLAGARAGLAVTR